MNETQIQTIIDHYNDNPSDERALQLHDALVAYEGNKQLIRCQGAYYFVDLNNLPRFLQRAPYSIAYL